MRFARPTLALCIAGFASVASAAAVQLVSDETIKTQKTLTTNHTLKNGIPVIVRQIDGSDIIAVNLSFSTGLRDLPPGKKVLNEWFWPSITMAGEAIPKAKVYETSEKFGLEIGCGGGIETASCSLGTINDYWKEGLALFSGLVTKPAFTDEDLKLTKDRLVASLKNTPSDPGQYVNEIINTVFYPDGHPYRLNHDVALKELETLGRKDLVEQHKTVMNAKLMTLVVATSMPAAQVIGDLDLAFGAVPATEFKAVQPEPPKFDMKGAYAFHDRDIPTAFIRIKLNGPSAFDKDAVAAKLLYEILSEELGDEVRTKRSLSYAVGSFLIQYSLGVGVISASTSKPKETLEAINVVLTTMKNKTFTDDELDQYKRTFATNYYLTLESHASLAGALSSAKHFYGAAEELYDFPRKLDKVTPADIKRLSAEVLSDLRVGVIYGRKEFEDAWALDLIKKNAKGAAPEGEPKKSY